MIAGLTAREEEVLIRIADGLTGPEIADELHLSVHTVTCYRKALLLALGARTQAHAVALAYHEGLLVAKVQA